MSGSSPNLIHDLLQKSFHNSPLILQDRCRDTELDMKGEYTTAHGHAVLWFVFEDKGGDLTGGAPEIDQAVYAVQRRIMSREYNFVRKVTACPCLVMLMSGVDVVIYAVYYTDKIYATRLCRFYLQGESYRCADVPDNIAKFQVIRNSARMLREYYVNFHTGCYYEHTPHLMPLPSSIISLHHSATPASIANLKSLNLTIYDRVASDEKGDFDTPRALFTGTIQHGGDQTLMRVYIKFVHSYGVEAHSYLASHDPPLAPQILFHGEVVSGITMVIMEDLEAVLRTIQPQAEAAPKFLHAGGFVHGNMRAPNIVVQLDTQRVYLVDFDWARKHEVARYPPSLNSEIKWIYPAMLLPGKMIKPRDDTYMLQLELADVLGATYIKDSDNTDLGEGSTGSGNVDGNGGDIPVR